MFQKEDKLTEALCRPDLHLGSPPAAYANAGRMNARGISVFYGATDADVALAEVRPPVGSTVAIAKFDIIRPLRLLDLTALDGAQDGGSVFGIIFGSAQAKTGRNVVLLHKAARVKEMQFPEGTEITADTGHSTEEGWEIDYYVSEAIPKQKPPAPHMANDDPFDLAPFPHKAYMTDLDVREPSLRVDTGAIEVHHVNWVKANSTRFSVSRHRHEKWKRIF